MLVAQAHALDGLFANLAAQAMGATQVSKMEILLRLAFKAQTRPAPPCKR